MKDSSLIQQFLNGDLGAFDKLFNRYSEKVFFFSLKYLKDEVLAEELVQEVFIKVWEKRDTLKTDTSFQSFLFTIAYNDILKVFRSKSYHQAYVREAMETNDQLDRSDEKVYYSSVIEHLDEVINKLPKKRRTIFLKSRKDGLSSKEIAKELGITPGTVDNNISDALKFLRTHLGKDLL